MKSIIANTIANSDLGTLPLRARNFLLPTVWPAMVPMGEALLAPTLPTSIGFTAINLMTFYGLLLKVLRKKAWWPGCRC